MYKYNMFIFTSWGLAAGSGVLISFKREKRSEQLNYVGQVSPPDAAPSEFNSIEVNNTLCQLCTIAAATTPYATADKHVQYIIYYIIII